MSKIVINKTSDHKKNVFIGVFLIVIILSLVFAVWFIQIRKTLLANIKGDVNDTVQGINLQASQVAQMQKEIEQILPSLNSDLDVMLNNIRAAVQKDALETAALDVVAQEMVNDLEQQQAQGEIIIDENATSEVASIETATLE